MTKNLKSSIGPYECLLASLIFLFTCLVPSLPAVADIPCPAPAAQVADEVKVQAQQLLQGGANLQTSATRSVNNLFAAYPNADRAVAIQNLLSVTCNLIKQSTQMSDAQKLQEWLAIYPVIGSFFPPGKELAIQPPYLDLGVLQPGTSRTFLEAKLGPPKFQKTIEFMDYDASPPTHRYETQFMYIYSALDVRIIYDKSNSAASIFIGLNADAPDPETFGLRPGDPWPIQSESPVIIWSSLKFASVADENCDQEVHSGASAALVAVICRYSDWPPGGSTYDRRDCYFSPGYSDGAFGVRLVSNPPELVESDLQALSDKGQTDDQVKAYVWSQIKDRNFNYMMASCDRELIMTEW